MDYKFWALAASSSAAAVFDIETTFDCKNRGTCQEGNHFMRPFIKSGRPATYAVAMAVNGGIMYGSYLSRKQGKKFWYVPMLSLTLSHGITGAINLRF